MGSLVESTYMGEQKMGRFESSRKGNRSKYAALGMTDQSAKKKMSKQVRTDYLAREANKVNAITPLSSTYS